MKELMEQMSMQEEPEMDMQDSDLESKMEVLKQLHEMMSDILGGDLDEMDEMEKVEIMAPDQEGLEEGLSMAQDFMKKKDDLM
jgi:hypothetical protein